MAMQEKGNAHRGIGIDGMEVINVLINMPEVAVRIGIGINNLMIDMNGKRIEVGELGHRVQIGADEVQVQHLLPYSLSILLSWLIGHSQLWLKRMRSARTKKIGSPSIYFNCMLNTSFSNRIWHGLFNLHMFMKSFCVCSSGGSWDSGPWEWDDTPQRQQPTPGREQSYPPPSPSGRFIPPSPAESRLPSPWEGGDTPYKGSCALLFHVCFNAYMLQELCAYIYDFSNLQ